MAATNGPSPLLDLPRETRDQIYRGLLTPTVGTQYRKSYGLEPSLLHVNRQVNGEASETLYSESCWILFTTNYPIYRELDGSLSWLHAPAILLPRGESSFSGQCAMRIDMISDSEIYDHGPEGLSWIIASVYDFQRTLSGLRKHMKQGRLQLAVGIQDPFQKHPQHHERMQACLRGIRGAARARIQGNQCQDSDKEIERQMMTQYRCGEQCVERMRTYQRRGDRQLALGKHLEAAMIYTDGQFDVWRYADPDLKANEAEVSDFHNQFVVLLTASALCNIKVGHIAGARWEISSVLRMLDVQDPQRATALYIQGLMFLAEDSYTDASVAFHEALELRPGYKEVVQELDKMKGNLQMSKETDDAS